MARALLLARPSRHLATTAAALAVVAACTADAPQEFSVGASSWAEMRLTRGGGARVDLLLVVGETGTATTAAAVAEAAAEMVRRLIAPVCVTSEGIDAAPFARADPLGRCPDGARPEAPPVTDLNVAVIGATPGPGARGLLAWDPRGVRRCTPGEGAWCPGTDDPDELVAGVEALVGHVAAASSGPGAPLEAALRHLIDPAPTVGAGDAAAIDEAVLAERRAFLRPFSTVVVALITAEDDCSTSSGADLSAGACDAAALLPVERYVNAFTRGTIDPRRADLAVGLRGGVASPLAEHAVHVASITAIPWQELARRDADGRPDLVRGLDPSGRPVGGYRSMSELEREGALAKLLPEPPRPDVPRRLLELAIGIQTAPWDDAMLLGVGASLASIAPPTFEAGPGGRTLDVGFEAAGLQLVDEPPCGGGHVRSGAHPRCKVDQACFGVHLQPDEDGGVSCLVLEARDSDGDGDPATAASCTCDGPARLDLAGGAARFAEALRERDDPVTQGRDCFCAIAEVPGSGADPGSPRHACQNDELPPVGIDGWCWIDGDEGVGDPELVSGCAPGTRTTVRLVGAGEPRPNTTVFIGCLSTDDD